MYLFLGILTVFFVNWRKKIISFFKKYLATKYPLGNSDICAVWGKDNCVYWETTNTRGILTPNEKIETIVRCQAGQNILNIVGITPKGRVPVIYLIAFPSLLKTIGLKRYFKLLKNWKGNSSVTVNEEEYRVVYYKLFGQR